MLKNTFPLHCSVCTSPFQQTRILIARNRQKGHLSEGGCPRGWKVWLEHGTPGSPRRCGRRHHAEVSGRACGKGPPSAPTASCLSPAPSPTLGHVACSSSTHLHGGGGKLWLFGLLGGGQQYFPQQCTGRSSPVGEGSACFSQGEGWMLDIPEPPMFTTSLTLSEDLNLRTRHVCSLLSVHVLGVPLT